MSKPHQDKLKAPHLSKKGKARHDKIFGKKAKPKKKATSRKIRRVGE